MNCHPTLCGMLVEVDGQEVVSVRGDAANPDSRGFLCVRGQASREIIGNPLRVLRPRIRVERGSDQWREAGWDEALDLIESRMREARPEHVGLWAGHGAFANNYGTRVSAQLLRRFSNLYGCQTWSPTSICWGLGAFGIGLTGLLEANTKEDLGDHAELVVMWGATLASQPNTARHLIRARKRGAHVVTIDIRETEATARSDEMLVIRPGTDAALALALMHVIVRDRLVDDAFVSAHTVGFGQLREHLANHSPAWAADVTGVPAATIEALARRYATTRPAMIVLGGSSIYKDANGWLAARAISCLPALTGNVGIPGGGLGPRHGAASHGQALADIAGAERHPLGSRIPNQMERITEALVEREITALLLFGTNMVSSFADAGRVAAGLRRTDLVVVHDLFMSDTARAFADIVLPATSWLEETGCKSTNTHLYLMPKVLGPPGEARSIAAVLRCLAERLGIDEFFWPWPADTGALDAILDHPSTGRATVAQLSAEGGIRALDVSPVGHPDLRFPTPSGKLELVARRAADLGLPALPVYVAPPASPQPLTLRTGRTLTHFHGFYDHGRALPSLASKDPDPQLWIAPADAASRGIADGGWVRLHNDLGDARARAHVTAKMQAGTVWIRSGWEGTNRITSGEACLPDAAVDTFSFSAGQASFGASIDVEPD
jgi:anaerobic selenocysteine-containing dehydrogenase